MYLSLNNFIINCFHIIKLLSYHKPNLLTKLMF